ncbi:MAG: hypothetical protein M1455_03535 [Actinobacteria bacterium]|nr:hypothetical protein [Actinomycetota bacterium]
MALTNRERNMVIGIVAAVVVAAIAAAFLFGRSSGDNATTATTPTATQTTSTATTQTQTTATVTNVQTVTQVTPQPGAGVEIVEQSINPPTAPRSGPIALTVRTRGGVNAVKMDISGRAPMSVDLVRGPTVNDITTWAAASSAPSLAGGYTFNAVVTAADGSLVNGPNSSFTVTP